MNALKRRQDKKKPLHIWKNDTILMATYPSERPPKKRRRSESIALAELTQHCSKDETGKEGGLTRAKKTKKGLDRVMRSVKVFIKDNEPEQKLPSLLLSETRK